MRDDIHSAVAPLDSEAVLGKKTIGAFATTNLDALLQADGIRQIIVGYRHPARRSQLLAGDLMSATTSSSVRTRVQISHRRMRR